MLFLSLLLICIQLGPSVAQKFNIGSFSGEFDVSGVLRSLVPASDTTFDFLPSDRFTLRNGNDNNHLGDIVISYRSGQSGSWETVSSASHRTTYPQWQLSQSSILLTSDLSSMIPNGVLNITRTWLEHNGDLILQFNVSNTSPGPVEIGALGFPMEFNNILSGRSPEEALSKCSFIDPYVGLDAGYAQVTRLTGLGPNLLVTPFNNNTKLEAWNFLVESHGNTEYLSNNFEGLYSWVTYSKALNEMYWQNSSPWNTPTSYTLQLRESKSFGLRFTVSNSVSSIESQLRSLGRPRIIGLPGYILPKDIVGKLYIDGPSAPKSFSVEPQGALVVKPLSQAPQRPWKGFSITPAQNAFGRARLEIIYADGTVQTVHYWVTHSSQQLVNLVGQFSSQHQWYTNNSDPFRRAPSIISWDKAAQDFVLQDNRAWIAGLSDEGGAGSFVTLALKQTVQPVETEIAQLEQFVNQTVWGELQHTDTWGVKKSLFYYQPDAVPGYHYINAVIHGGTWAKSEADRTDRAYDYVWVSALYWALYKSNRVSPGILKLNTAKWYLMQAYHTTALGISSQTLYSGVGLMGETFWGDLLQDLRAEGLTSEASALENRFKERQALWKTQSDPYGSEAPWDCTGQEGVYFWSQYFGDEVTTTKTIQSINGYDPTIPHWGYNGNARRYWDFGTAGEMDLARIERQIHHYGSSLNALPLLDWFRRTTSPNSQAAFYNLRVGYGGHMGSLSNVDENGFTSMAFHSFADTLRWDSYTGDYGPNFMGHVLGAGTFLVKHDVFGWVSFGGNVVSQQSGSVTVQPKDISRRKVYVAPLGVYIQLEAGAIKDFTWHETGSVLTINIIQDIAKSTNVLLRWEQTAAVTGSHKIYMKNNGLSQSRDGYLVKIPAEGSATVSWGIK